MQPPTGRAVPRDDDDTRAWWLALGAIALAGLVLRLVYVLFFRPWQLTAPLGDAWYYHSAANLLADGKGFIDPVKLYLQGRHSQAADHPPGYILALAVPSFAGLRTLFDHMIFSSLLGTATIALTALITRSIASARAGLIAAVIAAVYPNLWINDGLVMSETLTVLLSAVVILLAYRMWFAPSPARAAAFGVALGALILTRAEAALLIPFLVVPLVFSATKADGRRGLAVGAVTIAAAVAVVAPWTIYNSTRFDRTVVVSSSLGFTMQVANCVPTYEGTLIGYWTYACPLGAGSPGDPSAQDPVLRRRALDYMRHHASRLPAVIAAREGRTFGFFRPIQQLRFDSQETNRPFGAALAGLLAYYALVPFAIGGAVTLHRRKVTLLPLLSPIAVVVITVALIYGQTRFRSLAEVPIVVLAAAALERVLPRRPRFARSDAPAGPDRERPTKVRLPY